MVHFGPRSHTELVLLGVAASADAQDYHVLGLDLMKRVSLTGARMCGGHSQEAGAGTSSPSLNTSSV